MSRIGREGVAGSQQEGEEVEDRPLLEDEPPVHEQLAEAELRIDDQGALSRGVGQTSPHRLPGAVSEHELLAAGRLDGQRAARHTPRQDN
jgi:hypothetical protein